MSARADGLLIANFCLLSMDSLLGRFLRNGACATRLAQRDLRNGLRNGACATGLAMPKACAASLGRSAKLAGGVAPTGGAEVAPLVFLSFLFLLPFPLPFPLPDR